MKARKDKGGRQTRAHETIIERLVAAGAKRSGFYDTLERNKSWCDYLATEVIWRSAPLRGSKTTNRPLPDAFAFFEEERAVVLFEVQDAHRNDDVVKWCEAAGMADEDYITLFVVCIDAMNGTCSVFSGLAVQLSDTLEPQERLSFNSVIESDADPMLPVLHLLSRAGLLTGHSFDPSRSFAESAVSP